MDAEEFPLIAQLAIQTAFTNSPSRRFEEEAVQCLVKLRSQVSRMEELEEDLRIYKDIEKSAVAAMKPLHAALASTRQQLEQARAALQRVLDWNGSMSAGDYANKYRGNAYRTWEDQARAALSAEPQEDDRHDKAHSSTWSPALASTRQQVEELERERNDLLSSESQLEFENNYIRQQLEQSASRVEELEEESRIWEKASLVKLLQERNSLRQQLEQARAALKLCVERMPVNDPTYRRQLEEAYEKARTAYLAPSPVITDHIPQDCEKP